MSFWDRVFGDDHARAAQQPDRESASEAAARKRRQGHHRNLTANARQGQAWEDADRQRDKRGGWYRSR
ncbi:hypothetical protein [Streptomyces europaeiscabiei]|uniref:hypothetical protein n=1 Tax=Streptomyces europaeiscabiei TaxID=146819 RepID=UPI0029B776F6|nr:hypothetical protein [Streptomyces europaeiscabiei]MDX2766994.1 hypothetical protein [Streptomyces europaeiscabiei]